MKKVQLRRIYKESRKQLDDKTICIFQKFIYQQVFLMDFSTVSAIHIFLPIEKQKEINTYPIIDFLRKKSKNIIVSKSNFLNNTLKHYLLEENTVLETNKWGIPEPINAKEFPVKDIDLVFVPLLISDENNYRVGYGKGFYDRFLFDCKPNIQTIGLNFFKPVKRILDIDSYDVPLGKIIYPIN